jgi:hypothetical protein
MPKAMSARGTRHVIKPVIVNKFNYHTLECQKSKSLGPIALDLKPPQGNTIRRGNLKSNLSRV